MKKKLLISVVFLGGLLLVASGVWAGQARNNCGCGLGTLLWADKADGSILSQTMQISTNAFLGSQSFGITSGTLDCEQPENVSADDQAFTFIRDNMDGLVRDIAMGRGENLDTLAELMGVPTAGRQAFAANLQANFDRIFVTGEENAATVKERIAVVAG